MNLNIDQDDLAGAVAAGVRQALLDVLNVDRREFDDLRADIVEAIQGGAHDAVAAIFDYQRRDLEEVRGDLFDLIHDGVEAAVRRDIERHGLPPIKVHRP